MDDYENDSQAGKYLTFALGKELFGMEIRNVSEIIGIQPITTIPEVADYVKGIINLRGKIIPVIEARLKLKKESVPYDDRTCIIVIDLEQASAGLVVDNVKEVLTLPEEHIAPPPSIGEGTGNEYIKGIGKSGSDVLLLIDCEKLLGTDKNFGIKKAAQEAVRTA